MTDEPTCTFTWGPHTCSLPLGHTEDHTSEETEDYPRTQNDGGNSVRYWGEDAQAWTPWVGGLGGSF